MLLCSNKPADVAQICSAYSISTMQFETLHSRSRAAKATAYCPYSQFRVGATILTHEGQYIDGANVENASYPVGTCAERVAFGKAVTEGHKKFKAVAVATDITPPASPCGMCRQLLVSLSLSPHWSEKDEGEGEREGILRRMGVCGKSCADIDAG
jgi:cytidine deaminase